MTSQQYPEGVYEQGDAPYVTCQTLAKAGKSNDGFGCTNKQCAQYAVQKRAFALDLIANVNPLIATDKPFPTTPEVLPMTMPFSEFATKQAIAQAQDAGKAITQAITHCQERIDHWTDRIAEEHTKADANDKKIAELQVHLGALVTKREEQEAKTYELLKEQLAGMDTAEVANILLGKGMRYLTPPPISARGILAEARGIIQSSYWVTGTEWNRAAINGTPEEFKQSGQKGIVVQNDSEAGDWIAVTGVCSYGAISLARVAAEPEDGDRKLKSFTDLVEFDMATALAGHALANAIRATPGYQGQFGTEDGSLIASWNDAFSSGNTNDRAKVLAMFDKALQDPCLDFDEVWRPANFKNIWVGNPEDIETLFLKARKPEERMVEINGLKQYSYIGAACLYVGANYFNAESVTLVKYLPQQQEDEDWESRTVVVSIPAVEAQESVPSV